MDLSDYGPFATIIAMAAALAVSFGFLLTKAVGRLADWIWLSGDPPTALLRIAAKAPAIALIAWTYRTLDANNADAFLLSAVVLGILTAGLAIYLQRLIHVHVENVPVTGPCGQQAVDANGNPMFRPIFIGTEAEMLTDPRRAFRGAKGQDSSLSVVQFISGYGTPPYNPQAVWSRSTLAAVRTRLYVFALATVLAAIMTLYVAASSLVATPDGAHTDVGTVPSPTVLTVAGYHELSI